MADGKKQKNRPMFQSQSQAEAFYCPQRIQELYENPVQGNFDAAHLREINRRIFQDLPQHGFADVKPGVYRKPYEEGFYRVKFRSIKSLEGKKSPIVYSHMDEAAQKELDVILKRADPKELSKLNTKEFTQAIGKLYVELDHIHPFDDGNSRTLRTFTKQLAKDAGYDLNWETSNKDQRARDTLYLARDLGVNEIAYPKIQDSVLKFAVKEGLGQFKIPYTVPELLEAKKMVRPTRAAIFEKFTKGEISEKDAVQAHPELKEPLKLVNGALQHSQRKVLDAVTQKNFLSNLQTSLQEKLDRGDTRDFRQEIKHKIEQEKTRGVDLER